MKKIFLSILILFFLINISFAQDTDVIKLPAPQMEIGKPLMQALKLRASTRSFDTTKLSLQHLSNLLWAAYGINRPESGKRTVPSAMNWQEYDVYVVLSKGAYLYDAKENVLKLITKGDIREYCGVQDFVKTAPLNLVYVANFSRVTRVNEEDKLLFVAADCGFIAQNVYLYCASEGLACVVRGMINKEKLPEALKLNSNQKIILAQTVGYPKN
ncbi:SagB/ThcOx family dehydrogenase [Rosettibacter firmus]|uniref:SagB/ThcOx family dehydrogenase n=1 Tax=Rosettibacter firmus TaxID=3111522 RepID=UPI00336BD312